VKNESLVGREKVVRKPKLEVCHSEQMVNRKDLVPPSEEDKKMKERGGSQATVQRQRRGGGGKGRMPQEGRKREKNDKRGRTARRNMLKGRKKNVEISRDGKWCRDSSRTHQTSGEQGVLKKKVQDPEFNPDGNNSFNSR